MKGTMLTSLGLAAVGLGGLMILSWAASRNDDNGRVAYAFVVDYSKSTEKSRRSELGLMVHELDEAPPGASVVVYRMGSKTQEIFSGVVGPETEDQIIQAAMLDLRESDPKTGTDFADMADALAHFCDGHPGQQLRLRVLTDGGNDFAGDAHRLHDYRAAANCISANRNLDSLVFQGVDPGYREAIRKVFGKAGSKLEIRTQGQLNGS